MRQVWQHTTSLWASSSGFKLAVSYLALLLLLVILLPALPLPYDPNYLDLANPYLAPFTHKAMSLNHPLGTDGLGRDLLANLLYGARTAFSISLPVMALATILGVALGSFAGYYGEKGLQRPRSKVLLYLLAILVLVYYGLHLPLQALRLNAGYKYIARSYIFLLLLLFGFWLLEKALRRWSSFWEQPARLPVDTIVLRLTVGISSVPHLVLILILASFIPPSTELLALVLIFTLWPASARLARAEMLQIKSLPYFEAAKSIGNSPKALLYRHAFPNLLGPVLVAFTFGLGGLLSLESTLSFLNIGVPTTLVSWGRMIAGIRSNTAAWWLVAFPGGMLSLSVLAIYTCSHYLAQVFNSERG